MGFSFSFDIFKGVEIGGLIVWNFWGESLEMWFEILF